jgi:hypothetical protein
MFYNIKRKINFLFPLGGEKIVIANFFVYLQPNYN